MPKTTDTLLAEHGIASVTVAEIGRIIGDHDLAQDTTFVGWLIKKFAHRPRSLAERGDALRGARGGGRGQ